MEQSGEQKLAAESQAVLEERAIAQINQAKKSDDRSLTLESIGLEKLPKELFDLEALESLNLSSNKLREIPSEIGRLTNLRHLVVNFNELDTLPDELCELERLETLSVSNNRLLSLPVGLWKLRELRYLDLRANEATVPPAVGLLPRLAALYADRTQLPIAVQDMRSDEVVEAFRSQANKLFSETWEGLVHLNLESKAHRNWIVAQKESVKQATETIAGYEQFYKAKSTQKATEDLTSAMRTGLKVFGVGASVMGAGTLGVAVFLFCSVALKPSWEPKGAPETHVWQYIDRSTPTILLAALLFVLVKLTLAMLHNFTAINHKRAMLLTLNQTVQGFGAKMEGENIAKLLHEIVAHQPTGFVKGSGGDESAVNIGPIGLK